MLGDAGVSDVDYNAATKDTTSDQDIVVTGQCGDAGDAMVLKIGYLEFLGTD